MSAPAPRSETLDRIKKVLRTNLKLGQDKPIADDMVLMGGALDLDSLDVLLLVTAIEKEFGFKIANEAVGRDAFMNVATLARVRGCAPPWSHDMTADGVDLLARLPHRPPFLFVTRVIKLEAEAGEAVWALDGREWFLEGHFPGQPVVPGVLVVEALAQLVGLVAGSSRTASPQESAPMGRLAMVDVRFYEAVTPPVEIALRVQLQRNMGKLWLFDGTAMAGEKRLAGGTLTLAVES